MLGKEMCAYLERINSITNRGMEMTNFSEYIESESKSFRNNDKLIAILQEKLDVAEQAVSDAQYLILDQLEGGGVNYRELNQKLTIKFDRVRKELDACDDLIVKNSL